MALLFFVFFDGAYELGRGIVLSWRSGFDILAHAGLISEQNHFLARLDKVQEELLYYRRRWRQRH